ncbi:hypothetical protein M3Y99_01417800 [Aphelenchoides fujianensis]|nr:hypothetical protein M3Y99_01417800 [Aphelenchoides fujianensis]
MPTASINQTPCKICFIQGAIVSYFNVPVCAGCRRRKKYTCLNSRLCGKEHLVLSNRRVCKFCRFERCKAAGMLDAKLKLQNRLFEAATMQLNNPTDTFVPALPPPIPSFPLHLPFDSWTSTDCPSNPLVQFGRLRRRMAAARPFRAEVRRSPSAAFDMQVGLQENALFNHLVTIEGPFDDLHWEDWARPLVHTLIPLFFQHSLNTHEFSLCWSLIEQLMTTIRLNGPADRRLFNADGSFCPLDRDSVERHWSFVYEELPLEKADERAAVFSAVLDVVHRTQLTMLIEVGAPLAAAQLDEVEWNALLLLLMTRSSCRRFARRKATRLQLKAVRDQTLRSLAAHLQSTGRRVEERMDALISTHLSRLQDLVLLIKQTMQLLLAATDYDRSFSFNHSQIVF